MRTPVKFVELHDGFFLAGTNLPKKIASARETFIMEFDHDEDVLKLWYKDAMTNIPETNIKHWEPTATEPKPTYADKKLEKETKKPQVPHGIIKAQVSGPHDHVFAGPGGGKVRI